MISLQRAIEYAKTQGFRVKIRPNGDDTTNVVLVDSKRNELQWIPNHVEGQGVDKSYEDLVRAETR